MNTFQGVPLSQIHGHYTHACSGVCIAKHKHSHIFNRIMAAMIPSLHIRIERLGGGAAAEGFAAMMWPGNMMEQPLQEWDYAAPANQLNRWIPVEDWSEAACLERAIKALTSQDDPSNCMPHWREARDVIGVVLFTGPQQLDFHFAVARACERLEVVWQ